MQTLEQAAIDYAPSYENMLPKDTRLTTFMRESFKAGAEWQKEQYKEVIHLMSALIGALQATQIPQL